MNAVECEPVETRVLNPIASEASYKPKQRSYRKTNIKKKFWRPIVPAPKRTRPPFFAVGFLICDTRGGELFLSRKLFSMEFSIEYFYLNFQSFMVAIYLVAIKY